MERPRRRSTIRPWHCPPDFLALVTSMLLIATGTPAAGEEPTRGVLCVRKLPPPDVFASEGKGTSTTSYAESDEARTRRVAARPRHTIRVDDRPPVIVDQTRGGCIDGLALEGRHRVAVSRGGRPFLRSTFSFKRVSVLELNYNVFYGTLQIEPPKDAAVEGASCACLSMDKHATPLRRSESRHRCLRQPRSAREIGFL